MSRASRQGEVAELSITQSIRTSSFRPKSRVVAASSTVSAKVEPPITDDSRVKVRKTLEDAWKDAREDFQKKTHRPLASSVPVDLDTYMERWSKAYEVDESDSAQRKRRFVKVVQNIIDGFQVVGGLVAEGASMAFPPAGLCFSALSFLIELPRRIQGVYDTLLELFEEVENFLVRFKILKRIDGRGRLSTDIITSANKMLISFVEICSMSIDLLERHKIKTALKAALLNNDSGAGSSLTSFRNLAQSLDSLTSTVAFEHIVSIEEIGKDTNSIVKEIAANTNDEKTRLVNQERLTTIEEKIYAKGERLLADASATWPQDVGNLLPSTMNALKESKQYTEWRESDLSIRRAALLLNGDRGTGKSRMLEALKAELDEQRRSAVRDQPSTYVALHVFGNRPARAADSKKSNSPSSLIPVALRNMAVQVARQSTHYAADLEKQLSQSKDKPISQMDDVYELWDALKLSTFNATKGAIMYLLFDGVEKESESRVKALLGLFVGSRAEKDQKRDILGIRMILTCDTKLRSTLDFFVPEISMKSATKDLIRIYAETSLQQLDIFQDIDKRSIARKDEIIQAVHGSGEPEKRLNFLDVEQKLRQIYEAIQDDSSSEELGKILADNFHQTINTEAKRRLGEIAAQMSPRQLSQVNQIIPWILYQQSKFYLEIEELEAALYLSTGTESLQSFAQKIRDSYSGLFVRSGRVVRLSPEFEQILRQTEEETPPSSQRGSSLISLDISIKSAEESVVRQFIWQLNEQVLSGTFDFSAGVNSVDDTIYANTVEGHLSITKLSLKLLNEGWKKETEALVWYARECLPKHFVYLWEHFSQISISDRSAVTQGLVTFLNDPYHLENDQDRHFGTGEYWLSNTEGRATIRSWLEANRGQVPARESRWIGSVLQPAAGGLGFMKDIARAVARKWTSHRKYHAKERDSIDGIRKTNSLEGVLFLWLDAYIQNDLEIRARFPKQGYDITGEELPNLQKSSILEEHHSNYNLWLAQQMATNTDMDKVERCIAWAKNNHSMADTTGAPFINFGYTYLSNGEFDKAEAQFQLAREDPNFEWYAMIGLGRAAYAQGHKDSAIELMRKAFDLVDDATEAPSGYADSSELLRELATLYEELGQIKEAVEYYELSIFFRDDLELKWKLLTLFCEDNYTDKALKVLAELTEPTDEHGGTWLAQSLFQSANDDPMCSRLSRLVHAIQDERVRDYFVTALSKAVEIADKDPQAQARPGLLYLQGAAIARGLGATRRQDAYEIWRDALYSTAPENGAEFGFTYYLYLAAKGVAVSEFEQSKAELPYLAEKLMTKLDKAVAVEGLRDRLQTKVLRNTNVFLEVHGMVNGYLIAMNVMLGLKEEARRLSSADMSNALEILRDDDPYNDLSGIKLLMRVFCSMGDKVGALTAFSLLDRVRVAGVTMDTSEEGSDEKTATATYTVDSIRNRCDGCQNPVQSKDPEGLWWCQSCADFDLCTSCHGKFVSQSLNMYLCNPSHDFMHFCHPEYSREEGMNDLVRVNWEWVDGGKGKFTRKGGQTIPLAEWLEQLRLAWNLPEPQTTIRAQK